MKIKTLAMLKMEKNFRSHNEKGYPRQPYLHYDLKFWIYRLEQELEELKESYQSKDIQGIQEELADLSNLIDYAFERTFIETFKDRPFPELGKSQLFEHNKRLKET